MKDQKDEENIEKLLSMEIERKMRMSVAPEDVISFDEFVSFVSLSGGIPEWKIRETFRALTDEMAVLYKEDKEKFKEILKELCETDNIEIVEDDT